MGLFKNTYGRQKQRQTESRIIRQIRSTLSYFSWLIAGCVWKIKENVFFPQKMKRSIWTIYIYIVIVGITPSRCQSINKSHVVFSRSLGCRLYSPVLANRSFTLVTRACLLWTLLIHYSIENIYQMKIGVLCKSAVEHRSEHHRT